MKSFKLFLIGWKVDDAYPDVIAIVGPTASGKTALSVGLAKKIDGEVINGDAMQVIKDLISELQKLRLEEMDGIPHHLFDIKEPTESFSVAEYQTEVRKWIKDIQERGKTPIIVGGTGYTFNRFCMIFGLQRKHLIHWCRERLEKELLENGGELFVRKTCGQRSIWCRKNSSK